MTGNGVVGSDERLRRIEAVVDTRLYQLDTEQLLAELLDRIQEVLGVDTATILLFDPHSQQLVATAAKGIEEEVRAGIRVPFGKGFAGRVALDRRPIVLDEVRPEQVFSPVLRAADVRSLLGVPMLAGGDVIGVLQVGSRVPRRFTDDDVQLVQLAADRASTATRMGINHLDRTAALALQRSLLPTRLPQVTGVELASRYVPGHLTGVGGDWFDVFTLPSGWLGVVVGDVAGQGLRAAVVMGRLRSALRAYALECTDPADVLGRLDQKIRHFEAGHLATALYAMIPPDRDRIHISLAGHPPPILARPGEPAATLGLPPDYPLGFGGSRARRTNVIDFPAGAVLVCYTDGLVERRGEQIDTGLQRLCAAVRPAPAEALCAAIMSDLGAHQPTDDVALLAIRRRDVDSPEASPPADSGETPERE